MRKIILFFLIIDLFSLLQPAGSEELNHPPIANAGPNMIVSENSLVKLDASLSTDVEAGHLDFQWTQLGGPDVELESAQGAIATFRAPTVPTNAPVPLVFEVSVKDSRGSFATDSVIVMIENKNEPPHADAGEPQGADEQEVVILDARASSDPDKDPLHFLWTQTEGDRVQLSNPLGRQALFTMPVQSATKLGFKLWAWDDQGGWSNADVYVTLTGAHAHEVNVTGHHEPDNPPENGTSEADEKFYRFKVDKRVNAMVDEVEETLKTDMAKKNYPAIFTDCEKILLLNPKTLDVVALYRKAVGESRASLQTELDAAKKSFGEKDYLEAIRRFHHILELDMSNLSVQSYMNQCLAALERQSDRRQQTPSPSVQHARVYETERNVGLSRSLYREGLQLYSEGKLAEASKKWQKAFRLDKQNDLAHNAYSRAVAELHSPPEENEK